MNTMNTDKKALGQRIKSIRQEKGMTLEEFGKLFNASKSIASRWEKGISAPNAERLKAISKIGNMTVDELLYGSNDESLKLLISKLKEIESNTKHPEYYNFSDEVKIQLMNDLVFRLKNTSAYKVKNFADLPLKLYLENTFRNHYHKTVVANSSALSLVINDLLTLRGKICDYFELSAMEAINDNELLLLTVFNGNLNQKLGNNIINTLDESIEYFNNLYKKYPDELISESIDIYYTEIDSNINSSDSIKFQNDDKVISKVCGLFTDIVLQTNPKANPDEVKKLVLEKMTQHQREIDNFIKNKTKKEAE